MNFFIIGFNTLLRFHSYSLHFFMKGMTIISLFVSYLIIMVLYNCHLENHLIKEFYILKFPFSFFGGKSNIFKINLMININFIVSNFLWEILFECKSINMLINFPQTLTPSKRLYIRFLIKRYNQHFNYLISLFNFEIPSFFMFGN